MTSRSPPPSPGLTTLLCVRVRLFFARLAVSLRHRFRMWRERLCSRFKRVRWN